ncbi:hypothetical protein JRO89_XS02G0281000 [Xanthoceras sorbifolium]|uniref:Secreted protein n=1 Tax=Xanthoceras sorbifolium TaxID=99658 RepID=A0ABQ8IHN5_9ROSI|nr:hypothetical protein JRO89_XS02G0281000 [Xanthoceras sorbifolium]
MKYYTQVKLLLTALIALAIRIGTICGGLRMGAVIDCVFELPSILKLASCSTRNLEFKCSLLLVTNLYESVEGNSQARPRND